MGSPVNVKLDKKHEVAAGRALRALRDMGSPVDAQIAIACMCLYLCEQYQMDPANLGRFIETNIKVLQSNDEVRTAMLNGIHQEVSNKKIFIPSFAGHG